ncbi:Polyamine transporter 4 [Cyphellophora attinorum]|uniref:Polyamine transporter 4 n=1 Tax=Cyphellophora attinorum TaxID=1664694 RepID=A0A0N1H510_9EURO|nr:Polyamine transporter 4 [Phialophora attinorum]KPI40635.1 Polyamine transporter 4 [Phialophora attinorum]
MAGNDVLTGSAPAILKPYTINHQLRPGSALIVSAKEYVFPQSKLEQPCDVIREPVTPDDLVWDDEVDPDNPRNWPQWQRIYCTAIPALQLLIITMALSSYVPATPGIQEHFGTTYQVTTLGVSLYLLGLGIGPLPIAPLSEMFGRRPFYCYGIPLLLLFTIGSASAKNIGVLLVCRILGALLGSGALSVIGGTVLDIWDIKKGGESTTHVSLHSSSISLVELGALAACIATLTPLTGPVIGPVAATYIISDRHNDWRYGLWVNVFVGTPIFILTFLLRETYGPQILMKRAKRRGIALQDTRPRKEAAMHILHIAFTRPVHMLLTEPLVLLPAFYGGFTYLLLISFLGSYPYVFEAIFHFQPKAVSLAFLGILVGLLLGIIGYIACAITVKKRALAGDPTAEVPEAQLRPALIGSVLLPTSLFW